MPFSHQTVHHSKSMLLIHFSCQVSIPATVPIEWPPSHISLTQMHERFRKYCVCTVFMTSSSEGGASFFQCLSMTRRETTVKREVGIEPIPTDKMTRLGYSEGQVGKVPASMPPTWDHRGLIFGHSHSIEQCTPLPT